jgi:hypothetical protein
MRNRYGTKAQETCLAVFKLLQAILGRESVSIDFSSSGYELSIQVGKQTKEAMRNVTARL